MADPYFIEPFVDSGLGNSAYLVASPDTGRGVLIDPLRDVDRYLAVCERMGIRLSHVLDTHLHADFVSGNRELAAKTGAQVGASAEAGLGFDYLPLTDEKVIDLGAFSLRVLRTPGHSPEHISFLLVGPDGRTPEALFSGGALIVGGAARTDLIGPEMTNPLAVELYHTIHERLLALPDEVTVYPTHGAGSFCVAPASSERTTTIGRERRTNPLARARTEQEFIQRSLHGLPSYPTYYRHLREVNRRGAKILGDLPDLQPLSPGQVRDLTAQGAAVLDVRQQRPFGSGHIPGSYGIRVDAPLTTWAGWLIPFGTRLILVADSQADRQSAVRQLIRIGYDNLAGILEGGIESWTAAGFQLDHIPGMNVQELHDLLAQGEHLTVVDVRQQSEWDAGHIHGAIHIEAGRVALEEMPFPREGPVAIHCASGNRSMSAISVLRQRGYQNLVQVEGGINQWRRRGFEIEREPRGDHLIKL